MGETRGTHDTTRTTTDHPVAQTPIGRITENLGTRRTADMVIVTPTTMKNTTGPDHDRVGIMI